MKRRLLLEPDDEADPLWDYDTGLMVDLARLPLSPSTRASLRSWRVRWQDLAFRQSHAEDVEAGMSDRPSDPPSDADWVANQEEMDGLWVIVRDELGPAWQVGIARYTDDDRVVEWHPREGGTPPGLR